MTTLRRPRANDRLANVSIAIPLISPDANIPFNHPNIDPYNLIVRRLDENSYQAIVIYGPKNRAFTVGTNGHTDKAALLTFLEGTNALVGQFYDEGKLAVH